MSSSATNENSASSSSAASPSNATPASEAPVLFESAYTSRTFVLNRPKAMNALDQEMINLISPRIKNWRSSSLAKIIISRGNGRAYCAGGDVRAVVKNAQEDSTRHLALDYFKSEFQLDYDLATLPKPYVALIDGYTMGGGVGLSAYAPFRVATPRTQFAMPESKIGYCPDVGTSFILSSLDGGLGFYLALTGNTITGVEAFWIGLATHVIDESRLEPLQKRLGSLGEDSPSKQGDISFEQVASTIEEFSADDSVLQSLPKNSIVVGELRRAVDSVFGFGAHLDGVSQIFDSLSALASDQKKSAVVRDWANETLDTLKSRSPTSLVVAREMIKRSKEDRWFNLSRAFNNELRIVAAFVGRSTDDFITGVTTLLVNKDKTRPAWKPESISTIDVDSTVKDFFSPDSPYARLAPQIHSIASASENDKEPSRGDLQRYAIPREVSIRRTIRGEDVDSGASALSLDDLLRKYEERTDGKKGVAAKIREVVERCCQVDNGGWLKWVG